MGGNIFFKLLYSEYLLCARHCAVFFMLHVLQSSHHPFEVVYFYFLFSDGKQKLGETGQLVPDLTAKIFHRRAEV